MKQLMKIVETKKETRDSITISLKGKEKINFIPGQFVMVKVLNEEKSPKRAYSISSSPMREVLQITIKETPDGYVSKLLNQSKVGDELLIEGPFGHMLFDSEKMKSVVLIGAGSGIAPLKSISQFVLDKKLNTNITFCYSNRTEADIISHSELHDFEKQIKNFNLILAITREKKECFHCGRIDEKMIKEIHKKNPEAFYFLCGPSKMVNAIKELIFNQGIETKRVFFEVYN